MSLTKMSACPSKLRDGELRNIQCRFMKLRTDHQTHLFNEEIRVSVPEKWSHRAEYLSVLMGRLVVKDDGTRPYPSWVVKGGD